MDQDFGTKTTHPLKNDTLLANRHHPRSSMTKNLREPQVHLNLAIPYETPALYRNVVQYWGMDQDFGTKTTDPLKNEILLENRHHPRSSMTKYLGEPKLHLALAITCETPALYRNVVQCWGMGQDFGTKTTHPLKKCIPLANRHHPRSSMTQKLREPKLHRGLAITCDEPALYRNVVQYWGMGQDFGTKTTHPLKNDILLANRQHPRSSMTKKLREPKLHRGLAITCETPALYRNVVQYWGMGQDFGTMTTHPLKK